MFGNTQPIECVVLALAACVGIFYPEFREEMGTVMGICAIIGALRMYELFEEARAKANIIRGGKQDPWEYQRQLMLISDQELPNSPKLTKTSILYGALILEEAGETALALAKAIEEASAGRNSMLFALAKEHAKVAVHLIDTSKGLRKSLEACQELPDELPMAFDTAKELLDGCIDIHVVTCGMSLSTGLPGMDAYATVVSSNLSKANPVTGKIDKTPDGKWIKGSGYKAPDLDPLLIAYYNNPTI
jgi:hypothetical protein